MQVSEDEFVCRVAKTAKEIAQLIENRFESVCEQENVRVLEKEKVNCRGLIRGAESRV